MEWTADKVRKVQQLMHETDAVSLDEIIDREENEHENNTKIIDLLPSKEPTLEELMLKEDNKKLLIKFLGKLNPREEKVLRMRFGLDDNNQKTLEEIGKEFGITRERIRQVEARALSKLRIILDRAHVTYNSFYRR